MNYENCRCPVCGKPLLASEDVVVCPDCATPQHRACWKQLGRCANAEQHAAGFVWQPDTPQPTAQTQPAQTPETYICPVCGSENPADALHCGNCGALRSDGGPKRCPYCDRENDADALHCKYCGAPLLAEAGAPFFRTNPYVSDLPFGEDEEIDGERVGDLAAFVQTGAARYLQKFKRFSEGKKLSFNWAAFFFTPYWFFYRKLYKAGIFFLLLFAVVPLLTINLSQQVYNAVMPFYEMINSETPPSEEEATRILTEIGQKTARPMAIIAGIHGVMHLIGALTADQLYYRKVRNDLAFLREQETDETTKRFLILRRGGASVLNGLLSFFAAELISQLLYSLANTIASKL